MGKILVVGSMNMDLVVATPRVPVMGETILGSGFMTAPGGKGANQAVAAARLGGDVSMIGCAGDDIFGSNLVKNLQDNSICVENVRIIAGASTGIAMIVLNEGDNFIIVDPGANSQLTPQTVEYLEDEIKASDIVMVQLEIPQETVEKTIDIASHHGVKVLLNPAPARKLSDTLLSKVSIFTPNETECEMISGMQGGSIENVKKAAEYLHKEKGIPQVIVTMGGKGVVYNRGEEIVHMPVPDVEVVDTTAAGDSFSGAIAVSVSQGKDIDEAVEFANMVGSLTVTKKGAQTSLPTLGDVMEFKEKLVQFNKIPC